MLSRVLSFFNKPLKSESIFSLVQEFFFLFISTRSIVKQVNLPLVLQIVTLLGPQTLTDIAYD